MKATLLGGLLAVLLAPACASAQTNPVPAADPAAGVHGIVGMGLTFGGDKLDEVRFTNGTTQSSHAGGVVSFTGGVFYQPSDWNLAGQLTLNYHVDGIGAKNGSTSFSRWPVEAMVFYTGTPRWRFGVGVRDVMSPKYKASVDGQGGGSISFKDSTGAVLEAGYNMSPHNWVSVRLVSEKYKAKSAEMNGQQLLVTDAKIDGSHIGFTYLYQF